MQISQTQSTVLTCDNFHCDAARLQMLGDNFKIKVKYCVAWVWCMESDDAHHGNEKCPFEVLQNHVSTPLRKMLMLH